MELKVTPWFSEVAPTEESLRELLADQELRIHRWAKGPEVTQSSHTHGYHKILYVIEGNIRFDFPVRHERHRLDPGDRLDIPSGIRHSALSGPDGVICLEAHIY